MSSGTFYEGSKLGDYDGTATLGDYDGTATGSSLTYGDLLHSSHCCLTPRENAEVPRVKVWEGAQ